MNVLDIILVIPLIWFIYRGFTKGLIIEFASLVGLILGIWAAINFSYFAADILESYVDLKQKYISIIAFIITFIIVVVLVYLIGKIIEKFINLIALGFLNKLFGAFFGLLKAAFILSIIILIINTFDNNKNIITSKLRKGSILYKPIASLVPTIIPKLNLEKLDENMKYIKPDKLKEV